MPSRYGDSVFINCPFTPDYQELFHALVFAVADCGFIPRSALEKSDSGEARIDKLYRIIGECGYGLHDISVTDLDPDNRLPRFNMPLELGIFLGARKFGSRLQRTKGCLILDRERFRYQIFCSDLAGQDPKAHHGTAADAVRCVRNWLRAERVSVRLPSGERIWQRFRQFKADLPLLLEPDFLEFHDLTTVIEEWLRENPW